MKKVSKSLVVILVVSILLTLGVGCQSQTNNGTADKSTASVQTDSQSTQTAAAATQTETKAKKLVVWSGVPAELGPGDAVNEWNKNHPDVQVEYVRFVNDATGNAKLDTALMAGEQIDVFFSYSPDILFNRIKSGYAEDLCNEGLDKFIEGQLGENTWKLVVKTDNSKLYYLPTCYELHFVVVNKTLFDAKKIKVPTEWTIDEFRQIAKKLTFKKADGKMQYGTYNAPHVFKMKVGSDNWYKTDGTSNFDDSAFKEGILLYKDMMDVDKSTFPYTEVLARKLSTYMMDVYMNQEVAMFMGPGWVVRTIKDIKNYPHNWITSFAPLPIPEKGKQYYDSTGLSVSAAETQGMTYSNFIMMNSNSAYKAEAAEFMKYFITDGSIYVARAGKTPIWKDSNLQEVCKMMLGPDENAMKVFDVEAFKRVAFDKTALAVADTKAAGYSQIAQILKEEADKYYLGYQTIDEFAASMKKRADAAISSAQ